MFTMKESMEWVHTEISSTHDILCWLRLFRLARVFSTDEWPRLAGPLQSNYTWSISFIIRLWTCLVILHRRLISQMYDSGYTSCSFSPLEKKKWKLSVVTKRRYARGRRLNGNSYVEQRSIIHKLQIRTFQLTSTSSSSYSPSMLQGYGRGAVWSPVFTFFACFSLLAFSWA